VAGDLNGQADVFVFDRNTGAVERVSIGFDGAEANGSSGNIPVAISANGRYVAFSSGASNLVSNDTNGQPDVFVFDRKKGVTTMVSVGSDGTLGNSISSSPALSPDGRYVSFISYSTNLVAGDVNGKKDVFLHDRKKGTTVRISEGIGGDDVSSLSALSNKAKYVAFESTATNLVENVTSVNTDIYLRRR
jgi:Tol biopolymer transport system component